MITPAEAEALIRQSIPTLPAEDCPLTHALGRVLRAPILADRDLPPFDRVTMDGFAIRASATGSDKSARRTLRSIGFQAAGMRPLELKDEHTCVEIATGAVLPVGANAIVPYEDAERSGNSTTAPKADSASGNANSTDEEIVVADPSSFPAGTFVHRRGSDAVAGAQLVPAGTRVTGREIAVAASCGAKTLRV